MAVNTERAQVGTSRLALAALTVSGGNIALDAALSDFYKVTLDANATLQAPTNPGAGRRFLLRVRQDGTGGRTLAFASIYRFPGGTTPTISTGANVTDYLSFAYHETDIKWDYVGNCFNYAAP